MYTLLWWECGVRVEFERRYHAMPERTRAELIDEVFYLASPVRITDAAPSAHLAGWLGLYQAHTAGAQAAVHATVRLDFDNEPQPDALLRILPENGGQSSTSEDDYVFGPPELVAKVAASTVSIDLHDKINAYCRNAVQEYIVWRVLDEEIDRFVRRDERYERMVPDEVGIYRSEQFPGLWLDAAALLEGNMPKVLAVLQQGIESPAHADFVDHLRSRAKEQ